MDTVTEKGLKITPLSQQKEQFPYLDLLRAAPKIIVRSVL